MTRLEPSTGIAVLGAFRAEIDQVAERLLKTSALELLGPLRYRLGSIGSRPILVGTTGIGKVRAAAGTQAAIQRFRPASLIFIGTAGALSRAVLPLDTVVAEFLMEHDTGPGEPVRIGMDQALSDGLREAAEGTGNVHHGGLLSGDHPVLNAEERNRLHQRFGALAVDMEAAAAGAICQANQVPMAVLKVVTDSADNSGIRDFKQNIRRAAARAQVAVLAFLEA